MCVSISYGFGEQQLFAAPWIVAARGILQARILELVAIPFCRVAF